MSAGTHVVGVTLDSAGFDYGFFYSLAVEPDSVLSVRWPLLLYCVTASCLAPYTDTHSIAGLDMTLPPNGTLFLDSDGTGGVAYPEGSGNSYIVAGAPLTSSFLNGLEPAIGPNIYDIPYYVGRPVPRLTSSPGSFRFDVAGWILPPGPAQPFWTGRGISIEQTVTADDAAPGIIVVRVVFRNITDDPLYIEADAPIAQFPGITFKDAYVAFALDPDIGASTDDLISYAPELDMVFAYDSDFQEVMYGSMAEQPGLVGLRMLDAPQGSTTILTGWPRGAEWTAATAQERFGWDILSGTHASAFLPNHDDPRIGFVPNSTEDMRIAVTAGPLNLVAGDSAVLRVAIVIAEPTPGTYTSGTGVAPGDPLDDQRQIRQIAADLIQRAATAGQD